MPRAVQGRARWRVFLSRAAGMIGAAATFATHVSWHEPLGRHHHFSVLCCESLRSEWGGFNGKAPEFLGCRGFVDCSPLISCEGVRERHLSSCNANRQWESVQNCSLDIKKAGADQDPGQSAHGMPRGVLRCPRVFLSGVADTPNVA
jgi:hypothetical protein